MFIFREKEDFEADGFKRLWAAKPTSSMPSIHLLGLKKTLIEMLACLSRPSLTLVAIDCQSRQYSLHIQNPCLQMSIDIYELLRYKSILSRLSRHDRGIIYRLLDIQMQRFAGKVSQAPSP